MTLRAEAVTVRHRGAARDALDQVHLTVRPGELTVVAGPNGAGKSTLFHALLGLVPLRAGQVWLGDRPIGAWPRAAVARAVGAVAQREHGHHPQRVDEAVLLGRWARLGAFGQPGAADRDAVQRALGHADLGHLAARRTDTLSGGEWQRVRLARALASEPSLLLLDEPGSALDLAHEMAMLELLRRLVDGGLGILAITHHLNAAAQYADRLVLLDEGRIAAEGTPAEVLTAAHVTTVFRWPVRIAPLADGTPQVIPMRRIERT